MTKNRKEFAANVLIALCVLSTVGGLRSGAEISMLAGNLAAVPFWLVQVGLFYSVRWRLELAGHNHKVGRQAIAAILFGYSVFCVLIGVLALLYERGANYLPFVAAVVAICSGSAYACRRWQRRLRAAERSLASATPPPL